jgi:hypothetical protein
MYVGQEQPAYRNKGQGKGAGQGQRWNNAVAGTEVPKIDGAFMLVLFIADRTPQLNNKFPYCATTCICHIV